jgi:hypothetical protein
MLHSHHNLYTRWHGSVAGSYGSIAGIVRNIDVNEMPAAQKNITGVCRPGDVLTLDYFRVTFP